MARPPSGPALAGRSVAFVSFTSKEPSVMASPPRECAAGTSGLYCGPRTLASEGRTESVSVGGGRRGPGSRGLRLGRWSGLGCLGTCPERDSSPDRPRLASLGHVHLLGLGDDGLAVDARGCFVACAPHREWTS